MLKVAVEVDAPPVWFSAVQCRPPRTTRPLPRESDPMFAVAVAVRVAPLSMEACDWLASPLMVKSPPGTATFCMVVSASDDGWVVTEANSAPAPRPLAEELFVTLLLPLWLPLVDSTCTGWGVWLWLSGGRTTRAALRLERGADGAEVDGLRQRLRLHVLEVRNRRGERDGVAQASGRGRQGDRLGLGRAVARDEGGVRPRGRSQLDQADGADEGAPESDASHGRGVVPVSKTCCQRLARITHLTGPPLGYQEQNDRLGLSLRVLVPRALVRRRQPG